jgi:ankyrin repeat protein
MSSFTGKDDPEFRDALRVLQAGGFDASAPLFGMGRDLAVDRPRIIEWHDQGLFSDQPQALAEALSCACFLGRTSVAAYLLDQGVDPTAGDGTGMDAFHWAVNRGKLETVRLLIRRKAPLEVRNMHGTTVLGTAVWSIINEPWWPDQLRIIEELLAAGARVEEAGYPTGHEQVGAVLRRHGAS